MAGLQSMFLSDHYGAALLRHSGERNFANHKAVGLGVFGAHHHHLWLRKPQQTNAEHAARTTKLKSVLRSRKGLEDISGGKGPQSIAKLTLRDALAAPSGTETKTKKTPSTGPQKGSPVCLQSHESSRSRHFSTCPTACNKDQVQKQSQSLAHLLGFHRTFSL